MDSGERLPKSTLGMNEWYPLDKMAFCKLWPLCINERELGGSRSRWMERSRNKLMEADLRSFTAALLSARSVNSLQLVLNIMTCRNLDCLACCFFKLAFTDPTLREFVN